MIKVTSPSGETRYLSPRAVALVTEAKASSQWHGIKAYVKLFDGKTLECGETADWIAGEVAKAEGATS